MDLVALAGLVTACATALAAAAGLVAALNRRKTDRHTAEELAEERVQAERAALVTEYRQLLDPYRQAVADQEARIEATNRRLAQVTVAHEQCQADLADADRRLQDLETRLRTAEARIAELGG